MPSERFSRTRLLYGDDAMRRLSISRVCVLGAGAVGGYAIEALARSGVENFTVVDFDRAEESNINRQILALEGTLGTPKCELARRRILEINPAARVEALEMRIDPDNAQKICALNADIYVDAIDSLTPKVALLECALKDGKAIVSSMGAARKTDASKIRTSDISKSFNCPLAAKIRKYLHRRGIYTGFKCVFSSERPESESHLKLSESEKIMGSCAAITGIFGFMLADLAVCEIISKAD